MSERMSITVQRLDGSVEAIHFALPVTEKLHKVNALGSYIDAIDGVIEVLQDSFPSLDFEECEAYAPAIVAKLEEEQA